MEATRIFKVFHSVYLEWSVFYRSVSHIARKQSFSGRSKIRLSGWLRRLGNGSIVLPLFTAFAKPVFIAANFFD